MIGVEESEPTDIVDRLLWRDAQHMLGRHLAAGLDGNCIWCGWSWPCAPRRLAERAATAARRPWREAWTLRHDLNSMRETSAPRSAVVENGGRYIPTLPDSNRRLHY